MLHKRKITAVNEGQQFYYAGRGYVKATEGERQAHPAAGTGQVLAYSEGRGERVPVSFSPLVEVFVEQEVRA